MTNAVMQQIENPGLTNLSKIIDVALDPIVLVVISVIIAAIFFIKKKNKEGIFFLSVMGIAAILIKGFKFIFARSRPSNALLLETSNSFPSGHATIAVVFFGLLAFLIFRELKFKKDFNKKKSLLIILTTVLISLISGFTRIYLRVHWLSDVVAGFILGGIILLSGIIYYKKY